MPLLHGNLLIPVPAAHVARRIVATMWRVYAVVQVAARQQQKTPVAVLQLTIEAPAANRVAAARAIAVAHVAIAVVRSTAIARPLPGVVLLPSLPVEVAADRLVASREVAAVVPVVVAVVADGKLQVK